MKALLNVSTAKEKPGIGEVEIALKGKPRVPDYPTCLTGCGAELRRATLSASHSGCRGRS